MGRPTHTQLNIWSLRGAVEAGYLFTPEIGMRMLVVVAVLADTDLVLPLLAPEQVMG